MVQEASAETTHSPVDFAKDVFRDALPAFMLPNRLDDVEGFLTNVLEPHLRQPQYSRGIDSLIFNDELIHMAATAKGSPLDRGRGHMPELRYIPDGTVMGIGNNQLERYVKDEPHYSLYGGYAGDSNDYVLYVLNPDKQPVFASVWQPESNDNLFSGEQVGVWRAEREEVPGLQSGFSSADDVFAYLQQQGNFDEGVTWQNLHQPRGFMNPANPLKLKQ